MTQIDSVIPVNPYLYKYGLVVTNDATTPNTKLDIAAGACRDANNVMDICLGSLFPPVNQAPAVAAPLVLNAAVNGANGLDTGALAASKMYAVYLIGDSRYINQTACLLSLATNANPVMPAGYDSYRLIAYWATDGSSHFLKGYYTGNQGLMMFNYDAPQATAVTAGAQTAYTAIDLSALVPNINNALVKIQYDLTANAAADTLKMQGANATGDQVTVIAPVAGATAHTFGYAEVDINLVAGVPKINYKVSAGTDAVAIDVAGFIVAV